MSNAHKNNPAYVQRLFVLFGMVYFAQALSQHIGLINQPLQFYLKEMLGYDLAKTSSFMLVLGIPWLIKPLYGLISDFIPLLNYRRRTWLLVTNALAAFGFLRISGLTEPGALATALFLTALGTAATDVIVDAVMVESGKQTGLSARFQSLQWICYSLSLVLSTLFGGLLCAYNDPTSALHWAALIAMLAPLTVATASWLIVKEEKSSINLPRLKATSVSLWKSLTSKLMWAVVAFLWFFSFNPNLGDPWYFQQVDTLHFSQGFIGSLKSLESVGKLLGALLFAKFLMDLSIGQQLRASIATGVVATLGYLLLVTASPYSQAIAVVLSLTMGASVMIATLSTVILAARFCPALTEGFTFAALMSVINAAMLISGFAGSQLRTFAFHSYAPLVLLSAGCMLLSWLPMRWLEKQGELER